MSPETLPRTDDLWELYAAESDATKALYHMQRNAGRDQVMAWAHFAVACRAARNIEKVYHSEDSLYYQVAKDLRRLNNLLFQEGGWGFMPLKNEGTPDCMEYVDDIFLAGLVEIALVSPEPNQS